MSDISSLGYVRIQVSDPDAWRTFAFDVMGFAEGSGPDPDALYLRMDERHARIVLVPGDVDRLLGVGWQARDQRALARVVDTVEAAGTPVERLPVTDADERRVEEAIRFTDPCGTPVEVFHGPVLDHSPVVTPHNSRFVTDGLGLGHAVLPVTDMDAAYRFYTEVLGFLPRGAFRLPTPPEYGPMRVRFMGVNPRHHSLALIPAGAVGDPGLIHIMVEVAGLDDVGRALDRVMAAGHPLSATLGRHTNDKMVSFYVRTPGGWDLEYGTDGLLVDERYYTAEEITADSYWGHDWSGASGA
ncbi:VOC family protein [Haloechinothrix sp. YIM 98757]|uniref:VOC family protein n=1 Tax=Haloechinothrix aidingensis TaxID=2752311 RepID=A0A838ABG5_9PSEU|nr:VOC family protein [Haloechinothrix aidingensis]MBA0126566.1 VOC family protein [Haloechinothrix aidingensis]